MATRNLDRRAAIFAAALAGVVTMGADPAPAPTESKAAALTAAMTKAMPTPRLYHVTTSGTLASALDNIDMCVGVGPMAQAIAQMSQDRATLAALSKGCTQRHEKKDDGSFNLDMACDKAAGAMATSRMSMHGTINDWHKHMELVMDLGSGPPKTYVTDTHMTLLGDCPAGMKPDQYRKPDGEIVDPMEELAKLSAKMDADRAGKDGKAK